MQQHSTPVKERTPKLHIPSLGFPPELNADTTFIQHHPSLQIGESSVIEKQEKELELLIQELKDRDDELNDLVRIQQGQVAAWTEDRQTVLQLEERCLKLQADIESRDQQVMFLKSNLAESQSSDQEKTAQNKTLELKLRQCIAERERMANHSRNLEASISRLERSERSLQAIIAEKDAELQSFSKKLETGNAETQSKMKELRKALQQARDELRSCQEKQQSWEKEGERREGELLKARQENESLQSKLAAACQQVKQLATQLHLSGECDRRREQLLQLQRSRTERCSAELETLKTICSHQQQELLALKLNHTAPTSSLRSHAGSIPLDTSFISTATTDELSQLLSEGSIEKHLSGQLDSYEDTSTRTRQRERMERTWPQLDSKGHKDNGTVSTNIHKPLFVGVPDFETRIKSGPIPKEGLKLSEKGATKMHRAHDRRRTEPSNPLLTIPVQTPESASTSADKGDGEMNGLGATDTGGDSPLSLDLDHLALQVRDKLSSIFDYSSTPPMEAPVLLPAANKGRKPSKSTKSPPLERATRETGSATRGTRLTGKSTSVKIMKPLQPVCLLGKMPADTQSS